MVERSAGTRDVEVAGRTVDRLGFGAMRLVADGVFGPPADPPAALALLRTVVESGVRLIDTALAYGPELNELQVAEALHPYPADLVIATKGGLVTTGPREWYVDGRPEALREHCVGSLRRLRVDRIDLYQLHRVDPAVPLEESAGALDQLRREGLIGAIGLCNVTLEELRRAQAVAPIASVQNRYSAWEREDDAVLDACTDDGVLYLPWRPLGRGADLSALSTLAATAGSTTGAAVTPTQLALAWLLARSRVVCPIPGTSSAAHLAENLGARDVEMTAELFDAVAAATAPLPAPVWETPG